MQQVQVQCTPWVFGTSEVRLKEELQTLMPMFSEPWLFYLFMW